jgi:hypothetical protein
MLRSMHFASIAFLALSSVSSTACVVRRQPPPREVRHEERREERREDKREDRREEKREDKREEKREERHEDRR